MYYYECGYCGKQIKKRLSVRMPRTDKGPSCSKCYNAYFHNTMNKIVLNQKDQWVRIANMYNGMVERFEQRRTS